MMFTLKQRVVEHVLRITPAPRNEAEMKILISRVPRNRAEARRSIATKGKRARV
jgi:hypothetical protein